MTDYVTPRPWPEGTSPTPGQALQWLRACNVDEGKAVLTRLQEAEETALRCFLEDHRRRVDEDQKKLYALLRQREAILALPCREWDEDDADSAEARSARAYNHALAKVRELLASDVDGA